jgi:hypothetical protein
MKCDMYLKYLRLVTTKHKFFVYLIKLLSIF